MNKPVIQEREREPELLVDELPPIQTHATASFQNANALATVTRMPVAERSEPETPSQTILRLASDPNFDIQKLDRLVTMFREQEKDKQRQAFNRAMKECQLEMKPVARDARNTQTNSNYSTLGAVIDAIVPVYTRHGFSVSFGTDNPQMEKCYGVTALVGHDDGYERLYRGDIPIDIAGIKDQRNKTDTHGFGSTMSYGRRYLLLQIFNIATKDDDGNAAGGGKTVNSDLITPQQVETLQKRIISCGINVERFFKVLQIEKLEQLTVGQFDEAMQILAAKEAKDKAPTLRDNLEASLNHERAKR